MNNLLTIARREALLSVGLAVLYMLGWYLCAYAVPAKVMWAGWPLWFLLSCVFNPLLFVGLCALMIKRYFKVVALDAEQPLDGELRREENESQSTASQALHQAEPKHKPQIAASLPSPLRH